MSMETLELPAKTKEQEQLEAKQSEIDGFKMPDTCDGEAVIFYEHGVKVRKAISFVQKRNAKGLQLRLGNGLVMTNVPHIDDPRLKYNPDMRAEGAWEETSEKRDAAARLLKIEQRLNDLEALINEPAKKAK